MWNRQRFVKDPATGKRQARPNPEADWICEDVPALRIIDEELWHRVKGRQDTIRGNVSPSPSDLRPERARRPRYLFSGLITCAACGGGYTLVGARHYGCANTRNRGTCTNRLTIRRDILEASILNGLKEHLLRPDLIAEFAREYQREHNRLAGELNLAREARVRELDKVGRHIQQIIDAVKDGMRSASMAAELERLEARKTVLEREFADQQEPPPRLHPRLVEVYRSKVSDLAAALNAEETRAEAAHILRSLVDDIRGVPPVSPDMPAIGPELG